MTPFCKKYDFEIRTFFVSYKSYHLYYWYDICLGFQSDSKKSGFYIATHTVSCQNESRLLKVPYQLCLCRLYKGWFNRIFSRREIQNIHNVRKLLDQDKNLLLQGFFCLTFLLMMLCFWWRDFSNRLQTELSFFAPLLFVEVTHHHIKSFVVVANTFPFTKMALQNIQWSRWQWIFCLLLISFDGSFDI